MSAVSDVLSVLAAVFALLASIGILRFEGLFNRMHAASLASTFGILFGALAVLTAFWGVAEAWKSVLVVAFFYLTAPVGAHFLAQAAHRLGVKPSGETDDVEDRPRREEGRP